MYHDTQHPNTVSSHNMKTTTHDDMEFRDGSEEPPGRWHPSPSELEMDVDVDSEDEVDRHLYINDDADSHQLMRSPNHYDTIDRPNRSDVDPSTTRTIGITGSSDSHARTTESHARTEVGGRKKTWFDRLPFRQHISPPAPALPLSGAEFELDPHRLPLPTTRSRSKSRSRPQSRASTPLLPGLSSFPTSTSTSTSKNSNNEHEDNRTAGSGTATEDLDPEESDGEGEKMCRICFTGEDSDSDDDPSDSEAEDNSDSVDGQGQDHGQGEEKEQTAIRDVEQKKQKRKDQGPGSGSGLGFGRLISPCLCRGSMRVSSFLCQMSGVRSRSNFRWFG